jgi:hypothetical protein
MRLGMQPALPKVRSGVARADGLVAASIVILKRRHHAEVIAAIEAILPAVATFIANYR